MISTHSDRLDRWFGAEVTAQLSSAMAGSYFDPVLVALGDGSVRVDRDGDFVGRLQFGAEASYVEWQDDRRRRLERLARVRMARRRKQSGEITGLSSLIGAISAGKKQTISIAKAGVTGVANVSNTLWDVGAQPAAGSTSAAPGGSSPTNTTTGGVLYDNATGGDLMHFLGAVMVPSVGNNLLLLYDRFFQVNHNLATDPQAVSGVPTRYQDTTARNTFLSMHVTTGLGTGTPTYLVQYVDSEGNPAENTATQTIVGSAIARRFPFAAGVGNGWFFPLNGSDRGVRSIANLDLGATSTGNVDVILGKPIAWIPQPIANAPVVFDASMSPRTFERIAANACLAFLEINKGASGATNYSGCIDLVAG